MHSDPTPVCTHTYRTFTPTSPRPNTRDYDVISKIEAQKQINLPTVYPFVHTCINFPVDWFEGLSVWQEKVDPGARARQECQAWV